MLLGVIVTWVVSDSRIVIGVDETLERRWGKRIWGLRIYRDAVKSSQKHTVKSCGGRWQWSKAVTTRTTPVLLALFSLTSWIADRLHRGVSLSPHTTAWYAKAELTFAVLLEAVRASLWRVRLFPRPALHWTPALFPEAEREHLIQLLASSF
jgi:hypothetical protein